MGTIQKATGVKSQADGVWGEFIVELATKDKRNVAVIIPSSNEIVSPGNRFLGLGTIVMDPAQNLAGYTGNSDMVLQLMVLESLPAE